MSEFVDRMSAQRSLLQEVNSRAWQEELFGLSSEAVNRWMESNGVSPHSELVALLRSASERLSFLASKSQMHVAEEYQQASHDIEEMRNHIRETLIATAGR